MDKIIEYLLRKNKVEIVASAILFIFMPSYVIIFLYYKEWFETIEITKITVLNAGILAFTYVIQIFIYIVTNMIFTKKGKTIEEILGIPLLVLGISVQSVIIARVFCENLIYALFIGIVISCIVEVGIAILCEKSLKLWEKER